MKWSFELTAGPFYDHGIGGNARDSATLARSNASARASSWCQGPLWARSPRAFHIRQALTLWSHRTSTGSLIPPSRIMSDQSESAPLELPRMSSPSLSAR